MAVRIDNRLMDCPMVPVPCRRCDAQILVRKSSWNQTSVQWNADASARCSQRQEAQRVSAHGGPGVFLTCSELSESILDAVRHGDLTMADEVASSPT